MNVILSGDRLKSSPLRSGTRQGCLLSLLLSNIVLEVLARAINQEKEIKGIQLGKEEVKLSMFTDSMSHVENHEILHTKIRTNKIIQQISRVQNQYTQISCISVTNSEQSEKEIKKTIPFTIVSKRIKYLGINQRGEKLVH